MVVFSRHTFRSVGTTIGPQKLEFPGAGVTLEVPQLGYGMEATEHGLALARQFGAPAIEAGARQATEALGQRWNSHWDEVRADLSCSRDFFTALYLRAGLQPAQPDEIQLSGVPTREGEGVDAVTVGTPIRRLIPVEELRRLQSASPQPDRLRQAGDDLLRAVQPAAGWSALRPLPPVLDAQRQIQPDYRSLTVLASTLEMLSEQGPPLGAVFPEQPAASLQAQQREALRCATRFLGLLFAALGPDEVACASSVLPARYIDTQPAGRHVILASHDDDISLLLRALRLVDESSADELSILPLESVVFALDPHSVCVSRVSLQTDPAGWFPGPFSSRVIWKGTRDQWNERVQRVQTVAEGWDAAREARRAVPLLPAAPLNVRYQLRP